VDTRLHRIGICGYGYIHGYPRKICGFGYGYGCDISYPQQPCNRSTINTKTGYDDDDDDLLLAAQGFRFCRRSKCAIYPNDLACHLFKNLLNILNAAVGHGARLSSYCCYDCVCSVVGGDTVVKATVPGSW